MISLPNIRKLCLRDPMRGKGFSNPRVSDEIFHMIWTTNKIIDLNIQINRHRCEVMKYLIRLFPRMEKLYLSISNSYSTECLEFVLSQTYD